MSEAQMSQINTNRSSVFMRGFIVVQFTQTKILSSYLRTTCTWARAEINSHFAAGPQARWRGASDELYPVWYVRSEQQSQRACGPQPEGARRRRARIGFVAAPRPCPTSTSSRRRGGHAFYRREKKS